MTKIAAWMEEADRRGRLLPGAALGAAVLTAATFFGIGTFAAEESYLRELFFERSWIQYVTTFCFWIVLLVLAVKHFLYHRQRQGFERARGVLEGPEFQSTFIWADADRIRSYFTHDELEPYGSSISFRRIKNALDRLLKTQSTRTLEDYFRTRSSIDSEELESGYAGPRYFLWLIPTLGFIGTVLGIGAGIQGFAGIISKAASFNEVKAILPAVTNHLGTAFDTTLLALGLSTIAMFYMSALHKREEQLLERIDTLCVDGVCPLFREHSAYSEEMIRAFGENVEQIRSSMAGNRAAIEHVVRNELPALLASELGSGRAEALKRRLDEVSAEQQGLFARLDAAGERLTRHIAEITLRLEQALDARLRSAERDADGRAGSDLVEALAGMTAAMERHRELYEVMMDRLAMPARSLAGGEAPEQPS